MKIIEYFIQSKYDDSTLCEDGIFHNEHFIAVVDGVTSKGNIKWDGHTSGYQAKEIILKGLGELKGKETAFEVLRHLNTLLYKAYVNKVDFFQHHSEERLQATLVIYSVYHRQIWCFGDCQFMIKEAVFADEMKIDTLVAEVRSVYLQLLMKQGKTVDELCIQDPSYDVIFPIIQRQFLLSNCDDEYGFSVLDGFCSDFGKAVIKDVPQNSIVVLASDGYPKLMPTLKSSEDELEAIRINDPLCIRLFKSTRGWTNGKKSLDDRAYIRFQT